MSDAQAFEICLEIIRATIWLGITLYLIHVGRKGSLSKQKGYSFIILGFSLLTLASWIDVTDNIDFLKKFVVIGDTPWQAFLEKIIGYLLGSIFLYLGLIKIVPLYYRLERSKKLLRYQLYHDPLTDLPNRLKLIVSLKMLSHSNSGGILLAIEINDFKTFHDSLGPSATDKLLLTVARRLNQYSGKTVTVYRLGGKEFAVLVSDNDEDQLKLKSLAQNLHESMVSPIKINDHYFNISLNMGAAYISEIGSNVEEVIKRATRVMFTARDGKNEHVAFFHPDM